MERSQRNNNYNNCTAGWRMWFTENWSYEHAVDTELRIHPGEWDTQTSLEFWNKNGSPNLGQTTRPSDIKKERKKKKREPAES